jgi:drug/metabolite transporter (DMT)-like permease
MHTMQRLDTALAASAITLFTGVLWGAYWLPVRELAELGYPGSWGTLAITATTATMLLPFVIARRKTFVQADILTLAAIALGGVAFALYSISFLYGRVGIIILLWFFSPLWSVLIGRFVMGWETPAHRFVAVLLGIVGLSVLLGAGGEAPLPQGRGEWMSLAGGVLWSVSTTMIRVRRPVTAVEAAFMFALGATIACIVASLFLQDVPVMPTENVVYALSIVVGTALLWWTLSMMALLWAATQINPTRVSLLLMSEVLVGAATASLIAGEHLHTHEMIGGGLVLAAGLLEVLPQKRVKQEGDVSE